MVACYSHFIHTQITIQGYKDTIQYTILCKAIENKAPDLLKGDHKTRSNPGLKIKNSSSFLMSNIKDISLKT